MDKFPFLKEYTRKNEEMFAQNNKKDKKDKKWEEKFQWNGESYDHLIKESFFENPWKKFT